MLYRGWRKSSHITTHRTGEEGDQVPNLILTQILVFKTLELKLVVGGNSEGITVYCRWAECEVSCGGMGFCELE